MGKLVITTLRLYLLTLKLTSTTDFNSLLSSYCPTPTECQMDKNDNDVDSTSKQTSDTNKAGISGETSRQCLACSCDSLCTYKNNCCPSTHSRTKGIWGGSIPGQGTSRGASIWPPETDKVATSETILDFTCVIPRANVESASEHSVSVVEGLGLYMVTSCLRGIEDTRCTEPTVDVLEENLPHTSLNTSITYMNKFCGECNNMTNLLPWKPYITCSDSNLLKADEVLFPISLEKLYKLAVSSADKECGIEFHPPDNFDEVYDMCYKHELVQTCTSHNEMLKDACESFSMPYFHTEHSLTVAYANIFCYLCQNNSHQTVNQFDEILKFPKFENVLVGELNINNDNAIAVEELSFLARDVAEQYNSHCEPGHVYDPFEGNCRLWYCPTDSTAVKSACVPILKKVETATYQVRLTVEVNNDSDHDIWPLNTNNLTSNLLSAMFENDYNAETETILIAENHSGSCLFIILLMRISSNNDGTPLFRLEHFNRTLNLSTNANQSLLVSVRFAIGIMLEIVTYPNWNIYVFDTITSEVLVISYISDNILNVYEYPILDKLSFCLQVMLDRYEFADLIGAIRLGQSGIKLYMGEFIRVSDTRKVRICYDDFVINAPDWPFRYSADSANKPQVLTSIVCTSLSITCLAVTIATYTIFRELRSIPGKNNIVLSVHLLVAQCLYQFTFTETSHPRLCVAFGLMMHFFWLTSILWMSACTIHMFRTFVTKKNFKSKRSCEPQVVMYTMYCYVLAAIPVAINVGISLNESDGNLIGYGGHICYISKPLMVGFTFALPVGIIVVLNMVFFAIVMFKISESTMRFSKSTDRTNAIIYVRLSSLTGTTWIFGYIYIWTGFVPLEYIFIVLNAGQGVLIFFSFICNAKVMHLYQDLFRHHSRRLVRACCKSDIKRATTKQPGINKDVKTQAALKVSAESNKTNLSGHRPSTVGGLHFVPDQFPACLTVEKSVNMNPQVVVADECEADRAMPKARKLL